MVFTMETAIPMFARYIATFSNLIFCYSLIERPLLTEITYCELIRLIGKIFNEQEEKQGGGDWQFVYVRPDCFR